MTRNKCLVCFENLEQGLYHPRCCRALFDQSSPLLLEFSRDQLADLGLEMLGRRGGIPGVQTKLSLGIDPRAPKRLTIVGLKGRFVFKPPSEEFAELPENEALCMELAARLGLPVAPHGLVHLADGTRAYLSRRFDRPPEETSWHQEDFCQLAERPAADKYKGSLEAAGKLLRHSRQPGLDAVRFLELNLFCWLSGNADMHLKNFSLLLDPRVGWSLSPAYDLVSTALAIPDDLEETALTVNGKKSGLGWQDWRELARNLGVPDKVFHGLRRSIAARTRQVEETVRNSFLTTESQDNFLARWSTRLAAE